MKIVARPRRIIHEHNGPNENTTTNQFYSEAWAADLFVLSITPTIRRGQNCRNKGAQYRREINKGDKGESGMERMRKGRDRGTTTGRTRREVSGNDARDERVRRRPRRRTFGGWLPESEIDCSAITIRCTQSREAGCGRTLLSCRRNICECIFPDIETDRRARDQTEHEVGRQRMSQLSRVSVRCFTRTRHDYYCMHPQYAREILCTRLQRAGAPRDQLHNRRYIFRSDNGSRGGKAEKTASVRSLVFVKGDSQEK